MLEVQERVLNLMRQMDRQRQPNARTCGGKWVKVKMRGIVLSLRLGAHFNWLCVVAMSLCPSIKAS
jgi:hypothetical protein